MLKAIGFVIKLAAFSVLVLVVANWATWEGKTLSDHVRHALHHAERSDMAATVRGWTRKLTDEAREGAERKAKRRAQAPIRTVAAETSEDDADRTEVNSAAPERARLEGKHASVDQAQERIPSSERQKLRNLIQELNSSHGRD